MSCTTRRHNPEDHDLNLHRRENLKFLIIRFCSFTDAIPCVQNFKFITSLTANRNKTIIIIIIIIIIISSI
jgi:hypothetical protein